MSKYEWEDESKRRKTADYIDLERKCIRCGRIEMDSVQRAIKPRD